MSSQPPLKLFETVKSLFLYAYRYVTQHLISTFDRGLRGL